MVRPLQVSQFLEHRPITFDPDDTRVKMDPIVAKSQGHTGVEQLFQFQSHGLNQLCEYIGLLAVAHSLEHGEDQPVCKADA